MEILTKKWFLCSNADKTEIVEGKCKGTQIQTISFGGIWTSRSIGYETREELLEGEGVLTEPCKICGKIVSTKFSESTKKQLIEKELCFSCDFWDELAKKTDRIIANHTCYKDGGKKTNGDKSCMGFGGADWKIRMNDGSLIETNNLWCNGDIPKHFWERMPDNALVLQPITRTSAASGVKRTLWLPAITQEQTKRLEAGEHIQNVLTNYTDDEREFVLTGITADEWDELFKEDEE
jgi:hypothetical protein